MAISRRQFIHETSMALLAGGLAAPGFGASAAENVTRALSLKVLQDKLETGRFMAGERSVIRDLAGITRLKGYAIDRDNDDVVLFGSVDPAWPALSVWDLSVALRNTFQRYNETIGDTVYYNYPGCSIDPDAASITRLERLSDRIVALVADGETESAKTLWMEACRSPQAVRIFGIPDSSFAKTCITADYRMKGLCDATLELDVAGFASLAKRRADRVLADMRQGRTTTVSGSSINRFWFTPGVQEFCVDDGIAMIAAASVALKTEQEVMTAQGTMTAAGSVDPEAERWACDFTDRYRDIAEAEGSGIYFELEQLFGHVAVAKLLAHEASRSVLPDLHVLLDTLRIPGAEVPRELEGRGNLIALRQVTETERQILTQTASVQLCGGVGINIDITDDNTIRDTAGMSSLKAAVAASRPAASRLWWNVTVGGRVAA